MGIKEGVWVYEVQNFAGGFLLRFRRWGEWFECAKCSGGEEIRPPFAGLEFSSGLEPKGFRPWLSSERRSAATWMSARRAELDEVELVICESKWG
jgi:hypothetical protein